MLGLWWGDEGLLIFHFAFVKDEACEILNIKLTHFFHQFFVKLISFGSLVFVRCWADVR